MREIKFRGWNGKKIVKFYLCDLDDGRVICQDLEVYGQDDIMQYTGLKDKNDKDIYEGDIVNIHGCNPCIVTFGSYKRKQFMNGDHPHKNYGFYLKGIPSYNDRTRSYWNDQEGSILTDLEWLEIIGNIYENPELMENKTK